MNEQLYAGLDMHDSTTTGTIKDVDGNTVRTLKVDTTPEGIAELFHKMKTKQVKAVFEASRNYPRYAALLEPHCCEVVMAHPYKVRAIATARIKTDVLDSNTLADLLRGNLIPESYLPSLNIIELRELLRYRAHLSKLRARFKVQLRNILSREGKKCKVKNIGSAKGIAWLKAVELNTMNQRELNYTTELMQSLNEEIGKLDNDIEKEQYRYPEADILKSVVGIGIYSAMLILAEIADITRFASPSKLVSYAGLAPLTYQSSTTQYSGNITKQGSKWLRWILTQCTHGAIKSRKSNRCKRFYIRLAARRGKQKAIVATARKMLTIIWYLLVKNEYYENGLQAPRSQILC